MEHNEDVVSSWGGKVGGGCLEEKVPDSIYVKAPCRCVLKS